MEAEGSIFACGSTIAVGWIEAAIGCGQRTRMSGKRAHGAHELGLARQLFGYARDALELEDARLRADQFHLHHQLVARLHGPLESRIVDASEVVNGVAVRAYVQARKG